MATNRQTLVYLLLIHVLAVVGIVLFPAPGLESLPRNACRNRSRRVGNNGWLPSRTVPSRREAESRRRTNSDFLRGLQRIRSAQHLDRESSQSSCELRHDRRCFQPPARRLLVGASSMALSVGSVQHGQVVSRLDRSHATCSGQSFNPTCIVLSLTFGYFLFGWAGFFWLGAIRLVYCLHMQAFVNSLLHLKRGLPEGVDSSQNIWWLGPLQVTAWGENWHGNHHSNPASACFSRHWWQVDIGWYVICGMKALGLATNVRTLQRTRKGNRFNRTTDQRQL